MPHGESAYFLLDCEKVHRHAVGPYLGIREARKRTLDCKTFEERKRRKREKKRERVV